MITSDAPKQSCSNCGHALFDYFKHEGRHFKQIYACGLQNQLQANENNDCEDYIWVAQKNFQEKLLT